MLRAAFTSVRRLTTTKLPVTAASLSAMSALDLVTFARTVLLLDEEACAVIKAKKISGRALLDCDGARLERAGVPLDAACVLLSLTIGGAKTVRMNLNNSAEGLDDNTAELTFESPSDLENFLARQGAAGLRSGGSLVTRFKQVRFFCRCQRQPRSKDLIMSLTCPITSRAAQGGRQGTPQ